MLPAPICMPVNRPSTRCPPQAYTDAEQGEGVPSEEEEWPHDRLHRHDRLHGVLAGNFTILIGEGKQIAQ